MTTTNHLLNGSSGARTRNVTTTNHLLDGSNQASGAYTSNVTGSSSTYHASDMCGTPANKTGPQDFISPGRCCRCCRCCRPPRPAFTTNLISAERHLFCFPSHARARALSLSLPPFLPPPLSLALSLSLSLYAAKIGRKLFFPRA